MSYQKFSITHKKIRHLNNSQKYLPNTTLNFTSFINLNQKLSITHKNFITSMISQIKFEFTKIFTKYNIKFHNFNNLSIFQFKTSIFYRKFPIITRKNSSTYSIQQFKSKTHKKTQYFNNNVSVIIHF